MSRSDLCFSSEGYVICGCVPGMLLLLIIIQLLLMYSNMADNGRRHGVLSFGDLSVRMPTECVFPASSLKHSLNKLCPHCHSWTWAEERTDCCSNGSYVVGPLLPPPEDIAKLYGQRIFLQNQCEYNGLFAFTALGASPSPIGPNHLTLCCNYMGVLITAPWIPSADDTVSVHQS